jgi:hypothetical protein
MSNNMSNNSFLLNNSIEKLQKYITAEHEKWTKLANTLEEIQKNGITEETENFVWQNYDSLETAGLSEDDLTCAASNFEHSCKHTKMICDITNTIMDSIANGNGY